MCGIAGYFGTRLLDPGRLDATLPRMRQRGPDHAEWRHFDNGHGRHAYLLHSRLNIIDLDARADQPMHVGDKWICYNGELYNYVELKRELEAAGRGFRTTSDTEVLLTALDARGLDVFDRFEGMWALAVFDEADGSLLLSRDRFGEKPLYLFRDETGVWFASEIRFLEVMMGRRLEVDGEQIKRYLVNGYKALYKANRSFFRGVTELAPASLLRIDAAGREIGQRYWTPRCAPDEDMTRTQAIEGVRERLIEAVRIRLRADVPMAFCMSGGVDSNALIGIARNAFGYDVHGFTIANTDARYEESEMVETVVSALGIRHTSIPTSVVDFLPRLRGLIAQHCAPVYTITYYAHWLLMQAIHENGYRVSVSGTAADELFSGYYDHHLAYFQEVQREPAVHAAAVAAWTQHVKPEVRNPYLSNPALFVSDPSFRDHIFLDSADFSGCLVEPWHEPFEEEAYTPHLLRNRMMNEMFHEAVPVILHEDDLNAMYFSIENRSPFLDRRLFDFCYSIPTRHLMRDGFAKSVLRDAMRGLVPDAVLDNRRKVGFNAPIKAFLDTDDAAVRAAVLADGPIFDYVRRERIADLLDRDALPNSRSKFLFYFVSARLFLELFA